MAVHRSESVKDEPTADSAIDPMFARSNECGLVATTAMPPGAMRADTALQLVRDELLLDGLSRLNLATFVTTWMEPEAKELMADTFDKNMIDKDEYPRTAELERRCVNMISPCGTPMNKAGPPAPRPQDRARRRCSEVWRSSGAGASAWRQQESRRASPTW